MLGILFQQAMKAHQAGELNKACQLYQVVLQMAPNHFDALHFLGLAQADRGDITAGVRSIEKALQSRPSMPAALSNLASLYRKLGQMEEARKNYEHALSVQPDFPEALNGAGNLALQEQDFPAALAHFEHAIALAPDFAEAHNNRGNALFALRRLDEAVAAFQLAIRHHPGYAEAYNNLGFALVALRRCGEAITAYEAALERVPDYPRAKLNLGLCHLLMDDYAKGWPLYEYRWADQQRTQSQGFKQPRWHGQILQAGQTILLHAEQGLGDTLQFCRFIPQVAKLGARLLLDIPISLRPLLKSLDCPAEFVDSGMTIPHFDFHCPLASLPLAFATGPSDIPDTPYLLAPQGRIEAWGEKLRQADRTPRIGIVWAGTQTDPHRAIPAELLIRALPSRALIVLVQKDISSELADQLRAHHPGILSCGAELTDFADTAGLITHLDLLITIDTSVAHLAGALGIPAWVLLHTGSDWRWGLDGERTPWYPSLRLFRQDHAGDWTGLLQQKLRSALNAFMQNFERPS